MRALLYLALRPRRLLTFIGGIVGGALYVWFASVRAVPGVQARKLRAREARKRRERTRL